MDEFVRQRDFDGLIRYLMEGTHHGRPGRPTAVKRKAVKALERLPPEEAAPLALRWSRSPDYVAREMACALVGRFWSPVMEPLLVPLCDDGDWEVRECAAGMLARVVRVCGLETAWRLRTHPSVNVRRAVVLACKYVGQEQNEAVAGEVLCLLDTLMTDRSEYVRKNLGPFAIGDGLLRVHPRPSLAALRQWGLRDDEATRWNVAMAFSAAAAAASAEPAMAILHPLLCDERRFVWRASVTALKKLQKRAPDTVRPWLREWSQSAVGERLKGFVRYV